MLLFVLFFVFDDCFHREKYDGSDKCEKEEKECDTLGAREKKFAKGDGVVLHECFLFCDCTDFYYTTNTIFIQVTEMLE
jgi:hypothetical protein